MNTEAIASYALFTVVVSILCFFSSHTASDKIQKSMFRGLSSIFFVLALVMLGFDAWYKQAQLPAILLWLQGLGLFTILVSKILEGKGK